MYYFSDTKIVILFVSVIASKKPNGIKDREAMFFLDVVLALSLVKS